MKINDEGQKLQTDIEKTENFEYKHEYRGSYRNQIIMVCLINMPMLAYGTTIGWLSPMAVLLQSKDTPASEPFTDEEVSWMAAILFFTAVFGTLVFSVIIDRIGRKKSSILASIPFLICWSLKLISTRPWTLISARGIAGFASGGAFFLSANYVKEVSDDEISGALGAVVILFVNGGCFLSIVLSEVFGYYTILYLFLTIPVIHIIFFIPMPESPMYLIKCGKYNEALKVMAWLKSTSVNDEETIRFFNTKKAEIENENMDMGDSIISILTSKTMAKPVRLTWILVVLQEASGCLAVLLYAGTIFDLANRTGGQNSFVSKMTPNMQSIFVGILQVTGSILSITLVEKCGRRILLSSTLMLAAICMCILGTWFFMVERGTHIHSLVPIAAMATSILSYTGGFCPMALIILADTLPFKVRSKLAALIYSSTWFVDSLFLKFFTPIATAFGIYTAFWIFTGILISGFIYVLAIVPETKGKNYEEIIDIINGKNTMSKKDKDGMTET